MDTKEFDLRKLSDEEFIEFEKRFNAEKALRGCSMWPKSCGIDYEKLSAFVADTFPGAANGVQMNIRREIKNALLLLTDYATLNFTDSLGKDKVLLRKPRRKTQLKKTELDAYMKASNKFLDILAGTGKE